MYLLSTFNVPSLVLSILPHLNLVTDLLSRHTHSILLMRKHNIGQNQSSSQTLKYFETTERSFIKNI